MLIEIGHVEAIFRYPVKSMGGERLEVANLGWHGLDGDKRLAFRRMGDRSEFPWLTASKLPDLPLFAPHRPEEGALGDLPTHIRTPDGEEMPVFGEDLAREVGRRYGAPVQMMQLKHGIFDEASISVIALDTVREIGRLAGRSPDVRRFRPNVVVRLLRPAPFQEDEWLDCVFSFGNGNDAPAIAVTMRDTRCSMVNLDPDSASPAPEVLKAAVRANQNNAGIYGTVTRENIHVREGRAHAARHRRTILKPQQWVQPYHFFKTAFDGTKFRGKHFRVSGIPTVTQNYEQRVPRKQFSAVVPSEVSERSADLRTARPACFRLRKLSQGAC
jgi:MOSC domain-containing protein